MRRAASAALALALVSAASRPARADPVALKYDLRTDAAIALEELEVGDLDRAVDPNRPEAITRLTPGPFPEAESTDIRDRG